MARVLAFAMLVTVPPDGARFVLVERVLDAEHPLAPDARTPCVLDERAWLDACARVGSSWFLEAPSGSDVVERLLLHAVPQAPPPPARPHPRQPSPAPPRAAPSFSPSRPRAQGLAPSRPRSSKVVQLRVYPLPWLEGT